METVTGNDIATTQQLLEDFIAADYSLGSQSTRNCFCTECMEGPLNVSEFKARRPHADHPFLRVRKHTARNQVVSRGDLGEVIDTSRLQPFLTNGVSAVALHARHDVTRLREPTAERRVCERCQYTISSTDPEVTLCSIECLLLSNRAVDEPVIAPSQRNDPQQAAASIRTDVILSGRIRVRRKSNKRKTMDSDTEANDDDEMPLQGAQPTEPSLVEERGRPEVANAAAAGVHLARVERRWSIAKQATMAATSEQNPKFNRHDLERVRLVGTYARFMLDLLPDYAEDDDALRSSTT